MSAAHREVGVIVLAAGAATRFGGAKLAMPFGGTNLLRRATSAALDVSGHVIVVTGAHCEAIEPLVADLPVTLAYNPDWVLGMSQSIAHGIVRLCAVAPEVSCAVVMLADQVRVGSEELRQLLAAHAAAPDKIIAANYAGESGAPCLFPRPYFDKLMQLQGARGARTILRRHADSVYALPMPQAAIDIDTPADYADALAASGL